ncbi:MAG: carboxypeptidase-like regulatory domain-containing protein, partial [Bacteroidetes bacterium]|nr:carboxypeptidase-like regulatory domain-containing protein [Bacteroidota bacterium]
MKQYLLLFIFLIFILGQTQAQSPTQTVKGRVLEKDTKTPLTGAVVILLQEGIPSQIGASSDDEGYFKLNAVPVGKQKFKVKYIGYQEVFLSDIIVGSGKEVYLNIELEESVSKIAEVEVKGIAKGAVRNELATVSARTFDIAETERYAGSRQ